MNSAQIARMLACIMFATVVVLITWTQPVLAQDTSQTTATQGQPEQQTSVEHGEVVYASGNEARQKVAAKEPESEAAKLPQSGSMIPLLSVLGILSFFGFILSALPMCMKLMHRR